MPGSELTRMVLEECSCLAHTSHSLTFQRTPAHSTRPALAFPWALSLMAWFCCARPRRWLPTPPRPSNNVVGCKTPASFPLGRNDTELHVLCRLPESPSGPKLGLFMEQFIWSSRWLPSLSSIPSLAPPGRLQELPPEKRLYLNPCIRVCFWGSPS